MTKSIYRPALIFAAILFLQSSGTVQAENNSPMLPGVYDKLVNKKKLVIAYVGASVMAGAPHWA